MFRKGGSASQGIMSGMQREKFQAKGMSDATRQAIEERAQLYRAYAGDPIASALIEGGLRLVSEAPTSSTLRNIASIAREPVQKILGQEQQIGMKAVGDILAQQQSEKEMKQKMDIAKMKVLAGKYKGYESQTKESQKKNLMKTLTDVYPEYGKGSEYRKFIPDIADRAIEFKIANPGKTYITSPDLETFSDVPVGAYFYNPKVGQYVLRRKQSGNDAFIYVDVQGKPLVKE